MKSTLHPVPFILKLIVGIAVCILMFIVAMIFGAADISIKDIWLALVTDTKGDDISIIRDLRLPREAAAMVVGAALAVAGAVMQGMTRNPLADPSLLGLTSGANAALAVAMVWIPSLQYFGLMIACFIGAAVGAAVVIGISAVKKGGFSPLRIVLAGAAVSALLQAISEGIGLVYKISKDVSMWTAGGLIGTSWNQLQVITPFIACGLLIALLLSRQLTILSLNEEVAVGLGQKTMVVKSLLFIATIVLAGAAVALAGNMAFIGLMIPHIVRAFAGTDYRQIIPLSAFFGASFMLLADTIGRTIQAPYETPVAAIVSILGLPFFLFIVRKGGKSYE
ncbi:FecCD family ABC transporter permease [Marinicrinis lubricantis]